MAEENNMHCEEAEVLLAQMLYDELEGAEHLSLQSHLSSCDSCSRKLGEMKVAAGLVKEGIEAEAEPKLSSVKRAEMFAKLGISEEGATVTEPEPKVEIEDEAPQIKIKPHARANTVLNFFGSIAAVVLIGIGISIMIPGVYEDIIPQILEEKETPRSEGELTRVSSLVKKEKREAEFKKYAPKEDEVITLKMEEEFEEEEVSDVFKPSPVRQESVALEEAKSLAAKTTGWQDGSVIDSATEVADEDMAMDQPTRGGGATMKNRQSRPRFLAVKSMKSQAVPKASSAAPATVKAPSPKKEARREFTRRVNRPADKAFAKMEKQSAKYMEKATDKVRLSASKTMRADRALGKKLMAYQRKYEKKKAKELVDNESFVRKRKALAKSAHETKSGKSRKQKSREKLLGEGGLGVENFDADATKTSGSLAIADKPSASHQKIAFDSNEVLEITDMNGAHVSKLTGDLKVVGSAGLPKKKSASNRNLAGKINDKLGNKKNATVNQLGYQNLYIKGSASMATASLPNKEKSQRHILGATVANSGGFSFKVDPEKQKETPNTSVATTDQEINGLLAIKDGAFTGARFSESATLSNSLSSALTVRKKSNEGIVGNPSGLAGGGFGKLKKSLTGTPGKDFVHVKPSKNHTYMFKNASGTVAYLKDIAVSSVSVTLNNLNNTATNQSLISKNVRKQLRDSRLTSLGIDSPANATATLKRGSIDGTTLGETAVGAGRYAISGYVSGNLNFDNTPLPDFKVITGRTMVMSGNVLDVEKSRHLVSQNTSSVSNKLGKTSDKYERKQLSDSALASLSVNNKISATDNLIDLGASGNRFRHLYANNVNLYGTTAMSNLTVTGTFSFPASSATNAMIANGSIGGEKISLAGKAGSTMYYNGSNWINLGAGTTAQVITGGTAPSWGSSLYDSLSAGNVTFSNKLTVSGNANLGGLNINEKQLASSLQQALKNDFSKLALKRLGLGESAPSGNLHVVGNAVIDEHINIANFKGTESSNGLVYVVAGNLVYSHPDAKENITDEAEGKWVSDAGDDISEPVFKPMPVNPFVMTEQDPYSTFSLDSDSASYQICKRYLKSGRMPPPSAVRIEEFVNAFTYHDLSAKRGEAFGIKVDAMSSLYRKGMVSVRIGVKAKNVDHRKPLHVVLVIDTSSSMGREDRLPWVKLALRRLVAKLKAGDRLTVVTFDQQARLIVEHAKPGNKAVLLKKINTVATTGPTYLEKGVELGYEMAAKHAKEGVESRIILCSDGVANVGETQALNLISKAERYRQRGISLTSLGFGMGSYNDNLLEKLANRGDGVYAYVSTRTEAKEIFEREFDLLTTSFAKDAKIQVVFDKSQVRRYRLLGYENREIADQDFRNDEVDAGEVAQARSVTALYELELQPGAQNERKELGAVYLRYFNTQSGKVEEQSRAMELRDIVALKPQEAPYLHLAVLVGEFAELLRGSEYATQSSYLKIFQQAQALSKALPLNQKLTEFISLVEVAKDLSRR